MSAVAVSHAPDKNWNIKHSDLIFEVYRSIEIWYLGVDRLADDFSFGSMHKCAHFWTLSALKSPLMGNLERTKYLCWRSIALLVVSSPCSTPCIRFCDSLCGRDLRKPPRSPKPLPPPRPPPGAPRLLNPPRDAIEECCWVCFSFVELSF